MPNLTELGLLSGRTIRRGSVLVGFFARFFLAFALTLPLDRAYAQQMPSSSQDLMQQLRGASGQGAAMNNQTGTGLDSTTGQAQRLQPEQPAVMRRLPPSRLEQIMSARAGVKLEQFGYDQLGVARSVTVPETGAVQDDYILGPGDEIVVSLRGQESNDLRTTVNRNGQVVLPRLAPIAAAGRSFGSFRQDLESAVSRAYVASTVSASVGRVRQISVVVAGEVNVPGVRLLTGLSSTADALLLSGGVKKTGSLRNIRILRGGQELNVDLYGVLTGSGSGASLRLTDGDRIVVPPMGQSVAVAGLVRRAGIYELLGRQSGITSRALLALAGGKEVRGRYRLSVLRIEPDGRTNLVPLANDAGLIRDSEILRVELAADQAATQAMLSGASGLAGQYAVTPGSRLSDIVRAPGALGPSPYTPFGLIVRKDPQTLMRSLIAFTPVAVLGGKEDMPLQSDDIVRAFSVSEAQMLAFVLKTYLNKSALDLSKSRKDEADPSAIAPVPSVSPSNPFGLDPEMLDTASAGADSVVGVSADVQRSNIVALLDVPAPGTVLAQQRALIYQRQLLLTQPQPQGLQTGTTPASLMQQNQQNDIIQSQRQAALLESQLAGSGALPKSPPNSMPAVGTGLNGQQSSGAVDPYGQTPQDPQQNMPLAENYQDQSVGPEGFASNREARTFGELSRQLGIDPLVLVNFLIEHRAGIDGAVAGPGFYLVGPNASLNDLTQAAGGAAGWVDQSGIELTTTLVDSQTGRSATQRQTLPLRQSMLASYIVRPHDQFRFNRAFTDAGLGSVAVQGEVRFAGVYTITRGEHLSDVMLRAGGLTSTAYPGGTVYLRKSAAAVEHQGYLRAANEIEEQLLVGMTRVGTDKIPPETFAAMQTFISRLRTQKAMGRVPFVADPSVLAARPEQDPLLEAGDTVYVPQRPSTVSVLGEVMQPGSYGYQSGANLDYYVRRAGGFAQYANDSLTFVVMPDGSARKVDRSWLSFDSAKLPPGSVIVVPRDLTPIDNRQLILDVTGVLSSLAISLASLSVITR